jgi:uncharacterized hydantoinase/oxoprolinase family protein
MMPTPQFTVTAAGPDKRDIEKLGNVIKEAVMSISNASSLSADEVLDLLEKVHVEMVRELQGRVESLEDRGEIRRVDPVTLSNAIEEAIEVIATATDLDTEEITDIFTAEPGASVDNIVHRLRAKSTHNRFWHS